jgi:hypothetical protein
LPHTKPFKLRRSNYVHPKKRYGFVELNTDHVNENLNNLESFTNAGTHTFIGCVFQNLSADTGNAACIYVHHENVILKILNTAFITIRKVGSGAGALGVFNSYKAHCKNLCFYNCRCTVQGQSYAFYAADDYHAQWVEFNFTNEEGWPPDFTAYHSSYSGADNFFRFWNNNLSNFKWTGIWCGLYFLFSPSDQIVTAFSQLYNYNGNTFVTLH